MRTMSDGCASYRALIPQTTFKTSLLTSFYITSIYTNMSYELGAEIFTYWLKEGVALTVLELQVYSFRLNVFFGTRNH